MDPLFDPQIFSFLVSQINILCPHKCYKYSTSYYLDKLFFILRLNCPYRLIPKELGTPPHHYSTIFKRISKWNLHGIPKMILDILIKNYTEEFFPNLKFLNLFIDSTNIRNKNGHDKVSYNYKDKGKNNSKITLVIDKNRFPLDVQLDESKEQMLPS